MNHDSQLNLDCVISSCFLFPSLFFEIPTGFYIISIILRNPFVILFSPRTVSFNIPQGSILIYYYLLLFNIFINFITDVSILFSFKLFMYADNVLIKFFHI